MPLQCPHSYESQSHWAAFCKHQPRAIAADSQLWLLTPFPLSILLGIPLTASCSPSHQDQWAPAATGKEHKQRRSDDASCVSSTTLPVCLRNRPGTWLLLCAIPWPRYLEMTQFEAANNQTFSEHNARALLARQMLALGRALLHHK